MSSTRPGIPQICLILPIQPPLMTPRMRQLNIILFISHSDPDHGFEHSLFTYNINIYTDYANRYSFYYVKILRITWFTPLLSMTLYKCYYTSILLIKCINVHRPSQRTKQTRSVFCTSTIRQHHEDGLQPHKTSHQSAKWLAKRIIFSFPL